MKIDIKASHLDLTPALREYIEMKVGSLEKFLKRWETEGEVEVWVEIDRTSNHHHKGDVFRAVIDIRLPNKALRATEVHEDIRAAIDRAKDVMRQEIGKHKDILSSKKSSSR